METCRMNQEIHVDISPDGALSIEAHGFTGSACRAATAPIEKALGAVRSRKPKDTLQRPRVTVPVKNRLGGPQP